MMTIKTYQKIQIINLNNILKKKEKEKEKKKRKLKKKKMNIWKFPKREKN